MNSNSTEKINEWVAYDVPVACYKLKIVALYSTILFVVSMIANPSLIWIILRNKDLMNPANACVLPLAVLSIIGTLIELPLVTTSASLCKFTFGKYVCQWEGFVMYFIGCSGIYILAFISFIRYLTIRKKTNKKGPSYVTTVIAVVFSVFCGIFWAIMPIFGWSEYSLEGAMISCSVEWNKRTPSIMSYNIAITIFVYFLPLFIFIFTNSKILSIMKASRDQFAHIRSEYQARKRVEAEIQLTIRTIILIGGFLLSWTPYTIVCMYRAFIQDSYVSPMAATIPAFFGKFSLAWPALLSLFGNKDIRKKLIWFRNNNNKKHRSTGTSSRTSQTNSQSISANETEMTHKFNKLAV